MNKLKEYVELNLSLYWYKKSKKLKIKLTSAYFYLKNNWL